MGSSPIFRIFYFVRTVRDHGSFFVNKSKCKKAESQNRKIKEPVCDSAFFVNGYCLFYFDRRSFAPGGVVILFADRFVCADTDVVFFATGQFLQHGRFGTAFGGNCFGAFEAA